MKNFLVKRVIQDQKGSLLIGLIVVMTIFASMGAAMISVTTTSTLSQIWTGASSQAYYLAESGFRYAETEYANTGDDDGDGEIKDDRNKKLKDDWHDHSFTFSDSKKKFELKIYPYYLVTSAIYIKGVTSLTTEYAGEKPASFTVPLSGKLKIGTDPPYTYNYNSITSVFTISPGLKSHLSSNNMDVYLVTSPSSDGSIMTKDGSLTLADASFFPDRNGTFRIEGSNNVYAYKSRSENILQDIYDILDPGRSFSVTVDTTDDIILNPFLELHSIGIVDHGSSIETKREIVYSVPLRTNIEKKSEFVDRFEDKSKWEDSSLGRHTTATIGGDKALKVTRADSLGVADDVGSLIKLDSSEVDEMLKWSYDLAKNFLSYDAQVKAGFDPGVPLTYMAGISFRQDAVAAGNSYGVSFLKAGSSVGIPADLLPYNDCPMIVLWQQTDSGNNKKWLAYKRLIGRPIYLFDDIEIDKSKWTEDPPWDHIITDFHSTTTCWTDSPAGDYAEDVDTSLETIAIDLSGASFPKLSFWHHYSIFLWSTFPADVGGRADIEVSTDGGFTWPTRLEMYTGNQVSWENEIIDLSAYAGQSDVRIRFRLRSVDPWGICLYVGSDGWYIDDVKIYEDFPINEATLTVRVKEAATLYFTGGGATPIEAGDIVRQATNRGTVLGTPILASGSWTVGGNATGIILLNKISGSFTAGQPLYVNGISLATTESGAGFFRARDNYIRVYYGDISGYGTPDGQWLDYNKHGNPRGELHWPPDELEDWSADNDFFTLVQWNEVNSTVSSLHKISSLDEPDAILRTNELTTPINERFSDTEIGLHTFGDSSISVYFDDFGLQTDVPTSEGFLPAVQQ